MKGILNTLNMIYENLPMLLAIGAAGAGIALRVRKFMRMAKEEKAALLKAQSEKIVELVKTQLLAMVSKAKRGARGRTCHQQ